MADKKISALTAATTPLSGSEVLPIVQGGSTVKVSISGVTAGRAVSALSGSFGTGTPAYSIGGTQVGITNASASTYLSVYGGTGSTNGGFLLGGNNSENFANVFWNGTGNYMQLGTSPVGSKVRFDIEGIVVGDINTNGFAPTAGKGIDFSANTHAAGMTSELLNDYEEGTWTPVDNSGASLSLTNEATATYTRVGRMVIANFWVKYPVTASGAGMAIGGLPFTSASGVSGSVVINQTEYAVPFTGQAQQSGTQMVFFTFGNTQLTNANISNLRVRGTAIYFV